MSYVFFSTLKHSNFTKLKELDVSKIQINQQLLFLTTRTSTPIHKELVYVLCNHIAPVNQKNGKNLLIRKTM
jgi:hypothetical protein